MGRCRNQIDKEIISDIMAEEQGMAVQTLEEAAEEQAAAEAKAAETANQAEEASAFNVDVDIDHGIEWEVETEPAPERQQTYSAPHTEEYYQETVYEEPAYREPVIPVARRINKHIFTWVFSFYLGIFGVDRFVRGQVGLGVFKLLTFGGFGFWYLVDWVIAIAKSYGGGYNGMQDLLFDHKGRYIY